MKRSTSRMILLLGLGGALGWIAAVGLANPGRDDASGGPVLGSPAPSPCFEAKGCCVEGADRASLLAMADALPAWADPFATLRDPEASRPTGSAGPDGPTSNAPRFHLDQVAVAGEVAPSR